MLFFIIIQEPYDFSKINYKVDFRSLEASDILGYEVSDKLIKKAHVNHYFRQGEEDNLSDFNLNDLEKSLSSDYVVKKNDDITFKNNVTYKDSDIVLKTKTLHYSIKDKILSSNTTSDVVYNFSNLKANSFIYNTITKDLKLKEVNLCIEK